MAFISKKNNKKINFKNKSRKIQNRQSFGGKPPGDQYSILRTVNDIPVAYREEDCSVCMERLCVPNENDANINDAGNIVQLHPQVQPQSPHLFHYNCVARHFLTRNHYENLNSKCPICRFELTQQQIRNLLQEGGLELPFDDDDDGDDDDDDDGDGILHPHAWGRRHWQNYLWNGPRIVPDIGMYIPPPVVEELILDQDEPEGCSFVPGSLNPNGFISTKNKCSRTSAEFNNPYLCSISASNRCILKKKSHRPVGCKLIREYGRKHCSPTEEGENNEPDNCVISNHNRCKINPFLRDIPQGCVAVPIVYSNGLGNKLSYKCKPTDIAADNQPEYCEMNSLQNCQKKTKKIYRRI